MREIDTRVVQQQTQPVEGPSATIVPAGGELDHFYKGLDQRVAITSHRVGALLYGPSRLQAHVVQPRPNETLEYSFDGQNWTRMKPVGRPFYRATFTALIDAASLPEGLVDLNVRSSLTNETRSRQLTRRGVEVRGEHRAPQQQLSRADPPSSSSRKLTTSLRAASLLAKKFAL